jgi:hypothetical protein
MGKTAPTLHLASVLSLEKIQKQKPTKLLPVKKQKKQYSLRGKTKHFLPMF